jgi:hypothetical protein
MTLKNKTEITIPLKEFYTVIAEKVSQELGKPVEVTNHTTSYYKDEITFEVTEKENKP